MKTTAWLRISFLISSFFLTNCAHYYANESDLHKRIILWNTEKHYGKSISTLKLVKPSHQHFKELQTLLRQTELLATEYERQLIEEADLLTKELHWHQALTLYTTGLNKLPDSVRLKNAKDSFLNKRQQYIEKLQFNLLIAEGNSLPERAPLIKEIADTDRDNKTTQAHASFITQQIVETSAALLQYGEQALERNDFIMAEKCLTIAHRLSPNHESALALQKLKDHFDAVAVQKKIAHDKEKQHHIEALLTQYEILFENKQYLSAKSHIKQLIAYRSHVPQLGQLEMQLQQAIDDKIQSSIELGQRYYSQGQFEDAYHTWRESLNLSPNDAVLLAHIERVQRVMASLRRLNDSGQTLEFPSE